MSYVQQGKIWVPESYRTALHNSFTNTTRSRMRSGSRKPAASTNAHRDSRSLEEAIRDCQDKARNDLLAKSIMAARADAIVGDDPIFQALSDDPKWNTEVEKRFGEWCDDQCDISGVLSFAEICAEIVNSWDEDGGKPIHKVVVGSGRTMRCKLQPIEALRLVNPGRKSDSRFLQGGVAISETTGAATGYFIGDWNEQGTIVTPATEPTDASNIWMINNPRGLKSGQHRTEPMLTAVVDRLETINDSTEASWDAYQLAAMIALFIKKQSLEGPTLQDQQALAAVTAGLASSTTDAKERGTWDRGQVLEGLEGESIETISPAHPVTGFDTMLWTELQIIFSSMDMTPELVAMWFIKNYAASRSAISVAWRRIQKYQGYLIRRFMKPVYRWWVANEILSGRIHEVSGWKECAWYLPVMPVLDPKVEAEAELLKLSGNLTLHERSLRVLGSGRRDQFITKWKQEQSVNREIGLQYARPINQIQSEAAQVQTDELGDPIDA